MAWGADAERRKKRILHRIRAVVIAVALTAAGVYAAVTWAAKPGDAVSGYAQGESRGTQAEAEAGPPEGAVPGEEQDPLRDAREDVAPEEEVDVARWMTSMSGYEVEGMHMGVDVARYQGIVDWEEAAEAGMEFAVIRVGYRAQKTGEICEDPTARYNLQEAAAAGLDIGAYFFSTAVDEEEAREEADWVCDYISRYPVTYPVAYNCEGFQDSENRQHGLTVRERTDIAMAFLDRIAENDYTPMFYAAKNELENNALWETDRLESRYKIWVARYVGLSEERAARPDYTGDYDMWQYTNNGSVAGIGGPVDVNIAYFGYTQKADVKNGEAPEKVEIGLADLMDFAAADETVTAKDVTNLRSEPSTRREDTVVAQLKNGEQAKRTGMDEKSGWSRLEYNGQTVYAVSRFLTADLSYRPPSEDAGNGAPEGGGSASAPDSAQASGNPNSVVTQGGSVVTFTDADDWVSAKIEVNLRGEPSTLLGNDSIHCKLVYGDKAHRTGIAEAEGWSRVEYNGEVLYAVTSMIYVLEETEEQ